MGVSPESTEFRVCAAIVLLILGLLLAFSARSENRRSGNIRFTAYVVAIAALPFWGSVLYTVVVYFGTGSEDAWIALPYLLIYASLKLLSISLVAAVVIAFAYFVIPIRQTARILIVAAITAAFFVWAGTRSVGEWREEQTKNANRRTEERAAAEFVRTSDVVTREFASTPPPEEIMAGVLESRAREKELPFQYLLSVTSRMNTKHKMYVVVTVTRVNGSPTFRLACVPELNEDWKKAERCKA